MTKEEFKEQDIRLNKLCFDYQEKEKRITELEAQIEKMKCCQNCKHCKVYNDNLDYSHHIEGQLTKAKDIIKLAIKGIKKIACEERCDFVNKEFFCDDCAYGKWIAKAEQFLKE